MQYEWGTEMDFANLHLREAIDRVSYQEDFPEAADRPLILRWDPSARPIAILVLHGDDPMARMTEFAREVVKPALEQINGVSQAEVIGGAEREILVEPDFGKLRLYDLTMDDLSTALRVANISFPGGRIRKGPLHLPLRILGEFENLDEIRADGDPRRRSGHHHRRRGRGPRHHQGTGGIHPDRRRGSRLAAPVQGGRREHDRHHRRGGQDPGHPRGPVSGPVLLLHLPGRGFRGQESFEGLQNSLLYGSGLAFLVLFLFLMDWRSPLVVGLAIPVSIMTTFAFLYFAKVGLNLMSLGGLSLAAGMLVDNSIVVLENINRHLRARPAARSIDRRYLRLGAPPRSPRRSIAATLTTVAVFFPVIYVPGIAGEFFRDQALTVTISLLVSILAALLLQPMLSAYILKAPGDRPSALFRPFDDGVQRRPGPLPPASGAGPGPQGGLPGRAGFGPGRQRLGGHGHAAVLHARPHPRRFHPGPGDCRPARPWK